MNEKIEQEQKCMKCYYEKMCGMDEPEGHCFRLKQPSEKEQIIEIITSDIENVKIDKIIVEEQPKGRIDRIRDFKFTRAMAIHKIEEKILESQKKPSRMDDIEIQEIIYQVDNYPEPSTEIVVKMIKVEECNTKLDELLFEFQMKRDKVYGNRLLWNKYQNYIDLIEQRMKMKVV